jgi:hypothetical protein
LTRDWAAHGLKSAAEELPNALRRTILGSRADGLLPLDTVTPRQVYESAKGNGINLDLAQASGNSLLPRLAKHAGEYSLLGGGAFEKNQEHNIAGLDAMAKGLADRTGVPSMDRETFGNQAVQGLKDRQTQLAKQAGTIYEDLKSRYGATVPDHTDIRSAAQTIVDENSDYYAKHPEILSGGAGKAWKIVKSLASSDPNDPAAADNFKQLLNLRTDLMDIYRGPESIGSRPEGWLKQLVGVIDNAVTGPLAAPDKAAFRNAGDLYTQAKEMDNPQTTLGQVIRSRDGTTAANTIHSLRPQQTREFKDAMTAISRNNLNDQLRRQTIERYVSPSGSGTELGTLAQRFGRQETEQVAGHLQSDDIEGIKDLARISGPVYSGSKGSPTAERIVPKAEFSAGLGGLTAIGTGIATGSLPTILGGGTAALAEPLIAGAAGKAATNPPKLAHAPPTVDPLPAPYMLPGGSGQMPGVATIKDFKDLPKILAPALLKAEPKPVPQPAPSDLTPVAAKPVDDFGFVPDSPKAVPIAAKPDDDFGFVPDLPK